MISLDGFEWNPEKAAANLKKHNLDFADAAVSLEDPFANRRIISSRQASPDERKRYEAR